MIYAFKNNWRLYLMEATGLAIFMASACLFTALLESPGSQIHRAISDPFQRNLIMGCMMGLTALFIFSSPITRGSGAQINPAVTITFFRLGRITFIDALSYIVFQFIGGTFSVYLMAALMKDMLKTAPVNFAVTVPGIYGTWAALIMEFGIGFMMMLMLLFTSGHSKLKRYTRIIAAFLVFLNVVVAGPVSGFGMNPARTFASALPSGIWTAFWVYLFIPVIAMLCAAEYYLFCRKATEKPTYPGVAPKIPMLNVDLKRPKNEL